MKPYALDFETIFQNKPTRTRNFVELGEFMGISKIGLKIFLFLTDTGYLGDSIVPMELYNLDNQGKTINHLLAERLQTYDDWQENNINVSYSQTTTMNGDTEQLTITLPSDYDKSDFIAQHGLDDYHLDFYVGSE